jgi:hypothetical protein
MFDAPPLGFGSTRTAVSRFFFDYGHELAEAARLLGGAAAEARVVSCGIRLETASRIDSRIRRDLVAFFRLLALHDVGDPDRVETELFAAICPASPPVETICLLADLLEELLHRIDDDPPECSVAKAPPDERLAA